MQAARSLDIDAITAKTFLDKWRNENPNNPNIRNAQHFVDAQMLSATYTGVWTKVFQYGLGAPGPLASIVGSIYGNLTSSIFSTAYSTVKLWGVGRKLLGGGEGPASPTSPFEMASQLRGAWTAPGVEPGPICNPNVGSAGPVLP